MQVVFAGEMQQLRGGWALREAVESGLLRFWDFDTGAGSSCSGMPEQPMRLSGSHCGAGHTCQGFIVGFSTPVVGGASGACRRWYSATEIATDAMLNCCDRTPHTKPPHHLMQSQAAPAVHQHAYEDAWLLAPLTGLQRYMASRPAGQPGDIQRRKQDGRQGQAHAGREGIARPQNKRHGP